MITNLCSNCILNIQRLVHIIFIKYLKYLVLYNSLYEKKYK